MADPKDPLGAGELKNQVEDLLEQIRHVPEMEAWVAYLENFEEAMARAGSNTEDLTKVVEALDKQLTAMVRGSNDAQVALKGLDYQTELLITRMTGVRKATNATFVESFGKAIIETGNLSDAIGQMKDTWSDTMTSFNLGIGITRKVIESTVALNVALDTATSGFAAATGTGDQYHSAIKRVEASNRMLGVSANESAAAIASLQGEFTEFLYLNEDTQVSVANNVAQMAKFGVATSDTVSILETGTRVLGMTHEQTQALSESVIATSHAFGDDLNKVMSETAKILPQIAVHGSKTSEVLDNLYEASRRTGMEMGKIVGIAEKFDTFDSAAQAAGNLNAVLGGQFIDTMSILETTDPAERMQLFADAIDASGTAFEDLGYYQQKAIANAMGLSVEETRRMVLQQEEASELQKALEKKGLTEGEYNEMLSEGRSIMQEIQIIMVQMGQSMQPLLQGFKSILGVVQKILASGLGRIIMTMVVPGLLMGMGVRKAFSAAKAAKSAIAEKGIAGALKDKVLGKKGFKGAEGFAFGPGSETQALRVVMGTKDVFKGLFDAEGKPWLGELEEKIKSPLEELGLNLEGRQQVFLNEMKKDTKSRLGMFKGFLGGFRSRLVGMLTSLRNWAGGLIAALKMFAAQVAASARASSLGNMLPGGGKLGRFAKFGRLGGLGTMAAGAGALGAGYMGYKSLEMGKRSLGESTKAGGWGMLAGGLAALALAPVTGGASLLPLLAGGAALGGGIGVTASLFDDGGVAVAPQGSSPRAPLMTTVSPGEVMIPPARKGGTAQDAFAPLLSELKAGFASLNETYTAGATNIAAAAGRKQVVMDSRTANRFIDDYNEAPPINVLRNRSS